MRISLEWKKITHTPVEKSGLTEKHGIYLFTLRDTGLPFYVGTAETRSFLVRLNEHAELFSTGGRTFLRDRFFDVHQNPSLAWPRGLCGLPTGAEDYRREVFIPGLSHFDEAVKLESERFWRNRLEVYLAPVEDQTPTILKAIERKVQDEIQRRFVKTFKVPEEAFRIPGTHSTYLGKRENADLPSEIILNLNLDPFVPNV
jgi:hypothetical protein